MTATARKPAREETAITDEWPGKDVFSLLRCVSCDVCLLLCPKGVGVAQSTRIWGMTRPEWVTGEGIHSLSARVD